jgi:type IV secretion system protein VirB1
VNNFAALALVPVLTLPIAGQAQPALSPQIVELARTCAPDVHPLTVAYLVSAESHNSQYAVNVNGGHSLPKPPTNEQEARRAIDWLNERGWNYDVGYAQINSANFRSLGLTGAQLLDPCTNLRASAQILGDCYARAVQVVGEGQGALQRALSCYNTGSQSKGFANGYVKHVVAQVKLKIPALLDGPIDPNAAGTASSTITPSSAAVAPASGPTTAAQNPTVSTADQTAQYGEPGVTAEVEQGAFAHPEVGAYMRRVSAKGGQ